MDRLTIYYDGIYVPKAICTIDRLGGADDCESCEETCDRIGCICTECPIQTAFNKLGQYENMQEEIEKRLTKVKSNPNFPHGFKSRMIKDLEWVLKQIT